MLLSLALALFLLDAIIVALLGGGAGRRCCDAARRTAALVACVAGSADDGRCAPCTYRAPTSAKRR